MKYRSEKSRTKHGRVYSSHTNIDLETVKRIIQRNYNNSSSHYLKIYKKRGKRDLKLLIIEDGKIVFDNNQLDLSFLN